MKLGKRKPQCRVVVKLYDYTNGSYIGGQGITVYGVGYKEVERAVIHALKLITP